MDNTFNIAVTRPGRGYIVTMIIQKEANTFKLQEVSKEALTKEELIEALNVAMEVMRRQ